MAKINRFNGDVKAIASDSETGERLVFGSTTEASDELTDQYNEAMLQGWGIIGAAEFPPLEWFNAQAFTATQFIAYLHQMGIPEWNATQEYPTAGALCIYNGSQWSRGASWVLGDEPGVSANWTSFDLQAVARGLNVANEAVGLGVAGTAITAEMQYLYDPEQQFTYGLPSTVDTGEIISSISGSSLITSGGSYALTQSETYTTKSIKAIVSSTYDGSTDNTADIIAWLDTLAEDTREMYILDSNVVANVELLAPHMPVGVIFKLEYARTGNNTGSYLEKQVGYLSNDAVDNDTVNWLLSGHNVARGMNNLRTTGTDSANDGNATDMYALGKVTGGGARGVGLTQWRLNHAGGVWQRTIRKEAPYESVADKDNSFEYWRPSEVIEVGEYRKNGNIYKCLTAGTTGTASGPSTPRGEYNYDGTVTWEYVSSGDTTISTLDELGRHSTNSTSSDLVWNNEVMSDDDINSTSMVFQRTAANKSVDIVEVNFPTNSAGANVPTQGFLYIADDVSTRLYKAGEVGDIFKATDDKFEVFETLGVSGALTKKSIATTDGDTTPSVAGVSTLMISNTSATTITTLDDGIADQEVQLIAMNGNTTIKNGVISLSGGIDLLMTAYSVITLRRISTAITATWFEVSRSIK